MTFIEIPVMLSTPRPGLEKEMRVLTVLFLLLCMPLATAVEPRQVEIPASSEYRGKSIRLGAELHRPAADGPHRRSGSRSVDPVDFSAT